MASEPAMRIGVHLRLLASHAPLQARHHLIAVTAAIIETVAVRDGNP